jgi:hypothetical protein
MIRHMVLVRFRSDLDLGEIDSVLGQLLALRDRIPGMVSAHAGADVSPEGLARGYTHAFVMDFTDAAARDRYLVDEDHMKAGARLRDVAEGGRDGILVIDLEV